MHLSNDKIPCHFHAAFNEHVRQNQLAIHCLRYSNIYWVHCCYLGHIGEVFHDYWSIPYCLRKSVLALMTVCTEYTVEISLQLLNSDSCNTLLWKHDCFIITLHSTNDHGWMGWKQTVQIDFIKRPFVCVEVIVKAFTGKQTVAGAVYKRK